MRYGTVASALLMLTAMAGCPLPGPEDGQPAGGPVIVDPDVPAVELDRSCEQSASCAADEYCLDASCQERPAALDAEPGFPGLEKHDGVCRVVMQDDYNGIESTLQVERINEVLFVATNGVGGVSPWSVEVVLYDDGELDIAAGVPEVGYEELLDDYELEDLGPLSFDEPDGFPCSEFERSLIFFLIMEWFYFG